MPESHIQLQVHGGNGVEPVHAEPVGNRRYRVLASPGFVLGIAAGTRSSSSERTGSFGFSAMEEILPSSCSQRSPVQAFRESLAAKVHHKLRGVLDGGIECGLVFTISSKIGFDAIEAFFDGVVSELPGTEWMYGNVYDPETGPPLGWWNVSLGGPDGKDLAGLNVTAPNRMLNLTSFRAAH